jgi:hypothetical protein
MIKFLITIKTYLTTILTILFVIIIFVGIVAFILYLKNNNKKLQIIPSFKIIDMKKEENLDTLSESVKIAKNILLKVQK